MIWPPRTRTIRKRKCFMRSLFWRTHPRRTNHTRSRNRRPICLSRLYRAYPQHPGIPHYLIHACDNAELAQEACSRQEPTPKLHLRRRTRCTCHHISLRGSVYGKIPLLLTLRRREAAHQQGDTGEELHAMDYLVYAYLQSGRDREAAQVIQQLKDMSKSERR